MNRAFKAFLLISCLALAACVLYAGFWPVPPEQPPALVNSAAPAKTLCPPRSPAAPGSPQVLTVRPGESIQAAVDAAHPGGVVLVMPGTYHQQVTITTEHISLLGLGQPGQRPVLDGENQLDNGILGCADHLSVENFEIRNYQDNGVIAENVDGVTLRRLVTEHTGDYGLFPVRSQHILIEDCTSNGAADTGIYVGQSRDIVVLDSEAYGNVSGFEIENSTNAVVQNNYSHGNTAGLLMFVLPDLTVKETSGNRIAGNRLTGNNLANFADQEDIVSNIPAGTGLLVVGSANNEITRNVVEDNRSLGIGLLDLRPFYPQRQDFDIVTAPQGNWIHDNQVAGNGAAPAASARKTGLPGVDLLTDGSGWHNSWSETAARRFPPLLPGPSWSDFTRRLYYRLIALLKSL